ncbi:MAG: pyrroloquinoline quinone biosynthesis protein PqqE [Alphaproteobacteria bacterium]|nr:pyrroloquinoline quinone biosynthesis protein PqqE [Alphaproteobacteria bacterium]MBU0796898.1 pyrroloquinoline quinone biosynthesis protein PqqE [Alphaproteobacteria bacterium]MBU0886458.1 pyrroloquinoline quinone biosynthesis protein PqqE [Alphaproteobacteria bacterium]MBU1812319.1 pyrroloquinoline quinone biosynthesis protein PqqE [Alphaproteobacteria bacterium]
MTLPAPIGLLAELTYRCPLACPYCSNPLALAAKTPELDTAEWTRVLRQAADLGVLQVHLSGGEPAARRDLEQIVRAAAGAGLYTNLITSGIGLTEARLAALAEAGLDHVQLSIQDTDADVADRIAGYRGASERKRRFAGWVVASGLPLTLNAVIHRANIAHCGDIVDEAVALRARRVEIAHTQYHGWAAANRAALLPDRAAVDRALADVETARERHRGRIVVDSVAPDWHARFPKPCMGGWGARIINVTPHGKVLPCHAAESLPGLEFWNIRDHSLAGIWAHSPAFNAFRGTGWMPEPCQSCERRDVDFGGCRCQAFALTGDAAATDPICERSPHHAMVLAALDGPVEPVPAYIYRKA